MCVMGLWAESEVRTPPFKRSHEVLIKVTTKSLETFYRITGDIQHSERPDVLLL